MVEKKPNTNPNSNNVPNNTDNVIQQLTQLLTTIQKNQMTEDEIMELMQLLQQLQQQQLPPEAQVVITKLITTLAFELAKKKLSNNNNNVVIKEKEVIEVTEDLKQFLQKVDNNIPATLQIKDKNVKGAINYNGQGQFTIIAEINYKYKVSEILDEAETVSINTTAENNKITVTSKPKYRPSIEINAVFDVDKTIIANIYNMLKNSVIPLYSKKTNKGFLIIGYSTKKNKFTIGIVGNKDKDKVIESDDINYVKTTLKHLNYIILNNNGNNIDIIKKVNEFFKALNDPLFFPSS